MSKWSDVEFCDVYTYLIDTKGVYTDESLRVCKSLEVYTYYENGHVCTVYHLSTSGHYSIFKANVNPSQSSPDSYHEACVACEENGSVKTGHCTWMAGYVHFCCMCSKHCIISSSLGEVCSHVAALLFKIDAANRLGYTRLSKTSLPCQWNRNFKTRVSIQMFANSCNHPLS